MAMSLEEAIRAVEEQERGLRERPLGAGRLTVESDCVCLDGNCYALQGAGCERVGARFSYLRSLDGRTREVVAESWTYG
jgi:hypothetical protein